MTKAAIDFNLKYNLNVTPTAFEKVQAKNATNELSGRPKKNITQVFKRFFTNPVAVIAFVVFVAIILMSIIIPYTSIYSPNDVASQNHLIKTNGSAILHNQLGSGTTIKKMVTNIEYLKLLGYHNNNGLQFTEITNYQGLGMHLIKYNPWDVIAIEDQFNGHNSIIGTSDTGIDIWTRTWAGTWSSLKLAIFTALACTLIGVVIGGVVGYHAGSIIDIVVMKVISIYSSIPSFFWYMLIAMLLPHGFWALASVFMVTGWISSVGTTRIYMWRYVNSDFMKVAQTLGVSQWGRIFKHALPNFIGIILFNFVYSIPMIIEGEAGLGFLGLSPNPDNASLGNVLNEMKSTFATGIVENVWYIVLPTSIIFIITLSLHFVSVGLSDAVEPKFRKG